MPDLERSYRRLLWAYPGYYRRERGLEILTTMLDGAEPGQVRPSRREAVHLLLSGLRCRFVPATWIGRLAAGLVTIWAALVLSGAGALAVWGFAGREAPDLAAFSDDLVGRPASTTYRLPGDGPLDTAYTYRSSSGLQRFAEEGWDGRRPAPDGRFRVYGQVADAPAVLADAYRRLTGAGWRTGARSQRADRPDEVFWAYRDGALLRVSGNAEQATVTIGAYPVEPAGVLAGAIAGGVAGLILVAQGMAWMVYRVERAPRRTRRLVLAAGLPALVACGVNTLDNVLSMVPDPGTASVLLAADLMYPLANQVANPLAVGVVAVALLGSLGLIARAAGTPPQQRAQRHPR